MSDRQRPKVGEILVRAGVIDTQQLRAALGEQTRWGGHLGSTLIKLGFVEEKDLVRALASQLDLPMATLEGKRIPPDVLALVPREVADRERVLPLFIKREGGRVFLYVGVEDPGNLEAFDDLAFRTGMLIKPVMVAPSELFEAIDRCYHRTAAAESVAEPAAPLAAPLAAPQAAAPPKPASVVTPGTEELARHWSQSGSVASAPAANVRPDAADPGPSTAVAETPAVRASTAPCTPQAVPGDETLDLSEASAVSHTVVAPVATQAAPLAPVDAIPADVVQALIALLIEKRVLTRDELAAKRRDLALAGSGRD